MKILIHPKTGKTEIIIHSKDLWSGVQKGLDLFAQYFKSLWI